MPGSAHVALTVIPVSSPQIVGKCRLSRLRIRPRSCHLFPWHRINSRGPLIESRSCAGRFVDAIPQCEPWPCFFHNCRGRALVCLFWTDCECPPRYRSFARGVLFRTYSSIWATALAVMDGFQRRGNRACVLYGLQVRCSVEIHPPAGLHPDRPLPIPVRRRESGGRGWPTK